MSKSKIEWTGKTWNPVTGCTKISAGCKNCYAERMAKRLQAMGVPKYANGFEVTLHPDVLDEPLKIKTPSLFFVGSMSDLFHKDVPIYFVHEVFEIMRKAQWHTFQVLTKRAYRMSRFAYEAYDNPFWAWPANAWAGVSVENEDNVGRIDYLRNIFAPVRFLSCEPLLGPLPDLTLDGIDWVIVGGESGPHARPMELDWARGIRDKCLEAGKPFFLKQLGGVRHKRGGDEAILDGRLWHQWPKDWKGAA